MFRFQRRGDTELIAEKVSFVEVGVVVSFVWMLVPQFVRIITGV